MSLTFRESVDGWWAWTSGIEKWALSVTMRLHMLRSNTFRVTTVAWSLRAWTTSPTLLDWPYSISTCIGPIGHAWESWRLKSSDRSQRSFGLFSTVILQLSFSRVLFSRPEGSFHLHLRRALINFNLLGPRQIASGRCAYSIFYLSGATRRITSFQWASPPTTPWLSQVGSWSPVVLTVVLCTCQLRFNWRAFSKRLSRAEDRQSVCDCRLWRDVRAVEGRWRLRRRLQMHLPHRPGERVGLRAVQKRNSEGEIGERCHTVHTTTRHFQKLVEGKKCIDSIDYLLFSSNKIVRGIFPDQVCPPPFKFVRLLTYRKL